MSSRRRGRARAPIVVTSEDHHKLSRIAAGAIKTMPELSAELSAELDRARILPPGRSSSGHVRVGSEVRFRDETAGKETTVTLVWPEDADIAANRISVITPIGVALIGMAGGRSIEWTTRSGDVKRLTVVTLIDPMDAVSPN
ncbi:nucleoside diphosphate kinase regulator [Bosea psychrotolerans]|uniref:Regulator of nucleoside diphosphate kinase n=1 Tax=Bosea psychrotolerans TaxID=1871628 RepID=A0A2S4MKK1_9HYPH|nr:nucleoside diphosphate kinase regulator [Bosea psychrotolerans]POR55276.1 regulator of nucleoside diphosphate kinase [Bosea psychrotolerans]